MLSFFLVQGLVLVWYVTITVFLGCYQVWIWSLSRGNYCMVAIMLSFSLVPGLDLVSSMWHPCSGKQYSHRSYTQ
jgi:hypothetical protein